MYQDGPNQIGRSRTATPNDNFKMVLLDPEDDKITQKSSHSTATHSQQQAQLVLPSSISTPFGQVDTTIFGSIFKITL